MAAAAGAAGVVLSPVLSPAELVKCRLQAGTAGHVSSHVGSHVSGPAACVRQLLQREGVRGLTRGLSGTVARESLGNALFFTIYEASCYRLQSCLLLFL